MTTTTATRIGFVGLGHLGGNMAVRLLDVGYPVHGGDGNQQRLKPIVDDGRQLRETPKDIAKDVDIVFTSLPDEGATDIVASGPDGMLAGLATGNTRYRNGHC